MLGYQKDILGLEPLADKFKAFNWKTETVDGHDLEQLQRALDSFKKNESLQPKVLIADTVKGKGVPTLENDSLCHIRSLKPHEVDEMLEKLK